MITLKNIKKSFGNLPVLKDISFEIKTGELVSIIGASGAGKTTLLQIMGTLDSADEGSLIIKDTDVTKLSSNKLSEFRNKNIGFVFQFHQLLPEFSAVENVCMPAWIYNTNKIQAETRAKELLDYLGLTNRLKHKPSELSGGEQQRVAVARALINNPSIVLADEPSGNLDSTSAEALHNLFFDLRKTFNQTFIIVTHNNTFANRSDRTLNIIDGRIVG